jgi:ABC-2 type transport system ATP-binding protein
MTWGARDVVVRFGSRIALGGVSLEAPAGQVTAVVGGDGAGKTTLLRCLAGVVPVERGEVRRPDATRTGYLAATSGTYPDLTVGENLDFAAAAYGVPAGVAHERGAEYLERTGLASVRTRLVGNLSGGMRQKLGVIRALLHHPDLLVLDEPTTGIDPVSRVDLWWLIARAAAEGAAVVLATTYLDEAERATSVLVLDDGRALAEGSVDEIIESMPGALRVRATPPADDDMRARAWRRGSGWRVWYPGPDPAAPTGDERLEPDLQDAVTVIALNREIHSARTPESPS